MGDKKNSGWAGVVTLAIGAMTIVLLIILVEIISKEVHIQISNDKVKRIRYYILPVSDLRSYVKKADPSWTSTSTAMSLLTWISIGKKP